MVRNPTLQQFGYGIVELLVAFEVALLGADVRELDHAPLPYFLLQRQGVAVLGRLVHLRRQRFIPQLDGVARHNGLRVREGFLQHNLVPNPGPRVEGRILRQTLCVVGGKGQVMVNAGAAAQHPRRVVVQLPCAPAKPVNWFGEFSRE